MKTTRNISFAKPSSTSIESSFVKSFNIYGLTSSIYEKINNSDDGKLHITPCGYAPYGSTGSVYLDYNNTTIDGDPSVESFFSLIKAGATLTIVDAGYNYDESSLNGSYTFSELINSIVILQGITVDKLDSTSFKYYPEKFDNNPRIILGASVLKPLPDDQLNIENIFSRGTNSLINQGILPNDVIEHGEFKLKVISLTKNDINGHENLIVDISDISHTKIVFDTGITTLNLYRSSQTPVVKTPVVVTPVVLPTNMNMNMNSY